MRPVGNYGLPQWLRITIGLAGRKRSVSQGARKDACAGLSGDARCYSRASDFDPRASVSRCGALFSGEIDVAGFSFNKLVIFGVGLDWAVALLLRERGDVAGARTVIGVGRSPASTARALELGVIDGTAAISDDAALSAAPWPAWISVLLACAAGADPAAAWSGSRRFSTRTPSPHTTRAAPSPTSSPAARAALGDRTRQFLCRAIRLPGVSRAEWTPPWSICTLAVTWSCVHCRRIGSDTVEKAAAAMWRATGAAVHAMTPAQHDRVFASASHLP